MMSSRFCICSSFLAALAVFSPLISPAHGASDPAPAPNVHIEVYDEAGKPVKGVDVWVYPPPDSPAPPLTTGVDGTLDVVVKEGTSFSVSIFYLAKFYQTIEAFARKGGKPVSLSLALKKGSTSPESLHTAKEIHNRFTMVQKLTVTAKTAGADETPEFVKTYLKDPKVREELMELLKEAKTKVQNSDLEEMIDSSGETTLKGLDKYSKSK
jgi:hypothetical protein